MKPPSHAETALSSCARGALRAGEAPLLPGNDVRLLRDGPQVFAAWLEDIAAAREYILFENYIFNSDQIGRRVAAALAERARAGVAVYVLYDWFGCIGTSRRQWLDLISAGAEVRAFNPARLGDPLGAFRRDHRKTLTIDGEIAHIGGLCVGDAWAGSNGAPPWRDTAVRIRGPAATAARDAFDDTWSRCGPRLPAALDHRPAPLVGGAPVQIISGEPGRSRVYRVAQVMLSTAEQRVWITDAYFLAPPAIYESLMAAARDGVDVRVLLPGRSDLPWVNWVGRSGYQALLQAGVRIFEWDGPMLHAKTSVIDGRFSRVGSSNMNLSSLLTNWELDAAIDDPGFAAQMEEMFLADLTHATELVLRTRRFRLPVKVQRAVAEDKAERARRRLMRRAGPPGERARAVVLRAGAAVLGAALRRPYERSGISVSVVSGAMLLVLGGLGLWRPAGLGLVLAILLCWLGLATVARALSEGWQRGRGRPVGTLRRRAPRALSSPDRPTTAS